MGLVTTNNISKIAPNFFTERCNSLAASSKEMPQSLFMPTSTFFTWDYSSSSFGMQQIFNPFTMNITQSSFNIYPQAYSSSQTQNYADLFKSYFNDSNSTMFPKTTYSQSGIFEKQSSNYSKSGFLGTKYSTAQTGIVAMKDLGLKGSIGSCNSKPYIAARNKENLIKLDNWLAERGYTVVYTSAMGGNHKQGGKSHANGCKVDFQLYKNGKPAHLTRAELNELKASGYYGKGTGAVGWEPHANQNTGGHYDICIA